MAGKGGDVDIFQLLEEASEKKTEREQLLQSLDVKEFFEEGSIKIDTGICDGVECRLCIQVCPTNALYWGDGKVNVVEELCVFCTACVLSCIVDDCIRVRRKRPNGGIEAFSTPQQASNLLRKTNCLKRFEMVRRRLPTAEAYLERYSDSR
ncbi:MAG: 4Fe-4S dicluster domain-containing protein [Candidatus Bathyarchaeota archaeon]|nr:MAG: 4Fe-4S dicluster domain-containing protein [Candidatus Bathyarchaeota archaeon]